MNRRTAFLLALAVLLAHVLALHNDAARNFAGPYDAAHVDFRVARDLLRRGALVWQEGTYGGPPHLLWQVLLAALQAVGLPLLPVGQVVGLLAVLWTVVLAARFSTDRVAGIVSPVLLVFCGGFAAMAASGTDGPLVALLGVATFVAFQYGHSWRFGLTLALSVAARPEFVVLLPVYGALSLWRRLHRRGLVRPVAFLPAVLLAAVLCLVPLGEGGSLYGPWFARLLHPGERIDAGLRHGREFLLTTVTPLLLLFPLVELLTRRLSGVGRHALAVGGVWLAVMVLQGEGPRTFGTDLVPALPVVFLAVQQGMILALDTGRRTLIALSWTGLVLALFLSALASKYPGDLGPLPVEDLHREWMRSADEVPLGMRPVLGRLAVEDEIQLAGELRTLANFLGANTPGARVLSPWPGALADLGDLTVDDLSGRVRARGDQAGVTELLAREPDFVLPGRLPPGAIATATLEGRLARALAAFDPTSDPADFRRFLPALQDYWVLALPISSDPGRSRRPYYLLARRGLGVEPRLELELDPEGGSVAVRLLAPEELRLPLLASLQVLVEDGEGAVHSLDPRGELHPGEGVLARTGLLLKPQERGPIVLLRADLPAPVARVRARLASPGLIGDRPLYRIGAEIAAP